QRGRERLGMRHVALHDFNMRERCDLARFGRIAHQRARGDAARRQPAQQLLAVHAGAARYQNHGRSPLWVRCRRVPSSGAQRGKSASMDKNDSMDLFALWPTLTRRNNTAEAGMAKAKTALTCGCPVA